MHISQHTLFAAATMMSTGVLAAGGSSGCGKTPSVDPGHHHVRTVNSNKGGGTRDFILAIPSNYDSSKPVPLILSFHGNSRNMTNQLYLSEFIDEQWNPNAISVYPQGVNNMWQGAPYDKDGPDDLAFTADLIDALSNELCLDTTRVYCSGKSVGGGFCNVLACDAELSKRFAAIAPVSGAYYTTPAGKPFNTECHPARGNMPVLEFHGLADKTIPYNGGEHRGVDLRTVPDWAQAWADLDGCNGTKPTEQDTFNGNVKHYTWNCGNSTGGAGVVQHYAIEGLAHTWPSTGWNPDNDGHGTYINATPLIVDFFNKYSLPEPPVTAKPTVYGTQSVKRHHARMF